MTNVELRDIPGYEGLYATTEDGRVWSYKTNKYLKPCKRSLESKYYCVSLRKDGKSRTQYVHQLVGSCWVDNPNKEKFKFINHKNEDPSRNEANNLEWCDTYYNNTYGSKVRAIRCVETNEVWPSITTAADSLGVAAATLACIASKPNRSRYGLHYEYVS